MSIAFPALKSRVIGACKAGDFVFFGEHLGQYGLRCSAKNYDDLVMLFQKNERPRVVQMSLAKRCLLVESVEIILDHKTAHLGKAEPYGGAGTVTILEDTWCIWGAMSNQLQNASFDETEPFDIQTGAFVVPPSSEAICNFASWSLATRDPQTHVLDVVYCLGGSSDAKA